MDSNLPVLYEEKRPYTRKVKKKSHFGVFFVLILLLAALLFCVFGGEYKEKFLGFFGTSAENTENTETTMPETTTETESIYETADSVPDGAVPVIPKNLSADTLGVFAENHSTYAIEEIKRFFPSVKDGGQVVILNSEAYKSYTQEEIHWYENTDFAVNGAYRVGNLCKLLQDDLRKQGVDAVFLDTHTESAVGVYQNTENMMENALLLFPKTVLMVDISNTVLEDESGNLLRPVAVIGEKKTAQIRISVGSKAAFTSSAGAALALYENAKALYPDWVMPLVVEEKQANQREDTVFIHIAVGTPGNTAEEAENSIALLSEILWKLLHQT